MANLENLPEQTPSPRFNVKTFRKFDGSKWREYNTPAAKFILTSAGRELAAQGDLMPSLRHYIDDYKKHRYGPDDTRQFLAEGGNATVYSLGEHRVVIKEKRPLGEDLELALKRLDRLAHSVQVHCPRWIEVPSIYGLMLDKTEPARQFLIMQKVDEGVTVGDIANYGSGQPPREPHLDASIRRIFGGVTPELREEVSGRFGQMKGILRVALLSENLDPRVYLPDFDGNPYNVVVDKLVTPVAGSLLKFAVIDQ